MNNCKQQQNEANDNNLPYRFQISINGKYNKTCMEFLFGLGEGRNIYVHIFYQLRIQLYLKILCKLNTNIFLLLKFLLIC